MLWDESQEYQDFLMAVDDSKSIEGSLGADNTMAAQMLRQKAAEIDNHEVSGASWRPSPSRSTW